MKKDIHPTLHPTVFVDTSCGAAFRTVSTLQGEAIRTIDGVAYRVIPIEISSASHPFYTGKQILVDTARRVEKFTEKMKKVEAASAARKGKKVKRAKAQAKRDADKQKKTSKKVKAKSEAK